MFTAVRFGLAAAAIATSAFYARAETGIGKALSEADYDMGTPVLADLWVDPVNGDDARTGATRAQALRTLVAAWARTPQDADFTTGYRIRLAAGDYTQQHLPLYMELRRGTRQYPILIESADGPGAARLHAGLNIFGTSYLYLIGLRITPDDPQGGDMLHFERCAFMLVRGATIDGSGRTSHEAQETFKINQSQYIYVEDCDISGAFDNAVDCVAVQYGHFLRNKIHDAQDWCMYLKGGSAYFKVEANTFYNGGTGGFTAGQGTGFEYMVTPWLHYEAYDIKFVNNVIHDTEGAAFGVNGGYNILIAHNTAYRVGSRSHVIEVGFGLRTCDGETGACGSNRDAGGWGTTAIGSDFEQPIPNRNVYIYNNLIYNPPGFQSQWQHFSIQGPRDAAAGSNIASPAHSDTNLRIYGNLIWNGPADHPLGFGGGDDSQGCSASNPACNDTQVLASNTINTVQPQLVNPSAGNFHPVEGGNVASAATFALPQFNGGDRVPIPLAPAGDLVNRVANDFDGHPRATQSTTGAFALDPVLGEGEGEGEPEVVYFVVANPDDTGQGAYVLPLQDPAHILHARAVIADPDGTDAHIVVAHIAPGTSRGAYTNCDPLVPGKFWSWHIDVFEGFADSTIEIYDGWAQFVEDGLDGWIANTGGAIGFWNYRVVSEFSGVCPPASEGEGEGEGAAEGEGEGGGEGEGEIPSLEEAAQSLLDNFDSADANSDNALSLAEAQAALPGLSAAIFAQLDADHNSLVSAAELSAVLNPGTPGCNCPGGDKALPRGIPWGDMLLAALGLVALAGAGRWPRA